MNNYYSKEKNFWDNKGVVAYQSLSAFDQNRIDSWISWPGNGWVLDIGGGSGIVGRLLAEKQNTKCVCIDISLPMLKHSTVPGVQSDALTLPFRDECFDLVVAAAFFHHLPGREEQLLGEIFRVLKRGGRLVAYDPSALCLQNRLFMADTALRLKTFSPDERPVAPELLRAKAIAIGYREFGFRLFSFRNQRLTVFESVQRYLLSPLAIGPLRPLLERWFFWQVMK